MKVHRIGVLMFTSSPFAIEELRQGLRELGYVEGRNLTLEVRSAEGRAERLADLAAELVQSPGGPHCGAYDGRGAGSQARHHDAPDCCGGHDRPGTGGERGKPGAPGREHHGIVLSLGWSWRRSAWSCSRRPCQASRGWLFSSLRAIWKPEMAQSAGAHRPGTGGGTAPGGGARTRRRRARLKRDSARAG